MEPLKTLDLDCNFTQKSKKDHFPIIYRSIIIGAFCIGTRLDEKSKTSHTIFWFASLYIDICANPML